MRWFNLRSAVPRCLGGCLGVGLLGVAGLGALRHRHGQAAHPDAQQAVAQQTVAQQTALPTEGLRYRAQNLERATAHVVTVPPAYKVTVAIADETTDALTPVAAIAQSQGAIAALNAGFFDPQNGQTTSYITIDGELIADPRDNGRLMDNPDLLPYREQILNRSEFRRYRCSGLDREDSHFRYGIAPHSSPPPCGCHIVDVVGGGPSLLPLTSEAEGFVAEVDGARIRDALGETQPNARSAVGITPEGEVLLVAVEQRPELDRSGVSLPELADLMRSLGAQTALNLDGGSSTTLYYQGQTYAGRWVEGAPVERPVKSALVVMDGATAAP